MSTVLDDALRYVAAQYCQWTRFVDRFSRLQNFDIHARHDIIRPRPPISNPRVYGAKCQPFGQLSRELLASFFVSRIYCAPELLRSGHGFPGARLLGAFGFSLGKVSLLFSISRCFAISPSLFLSLSLSLFWYHTVQTSGLASNSK